MSSNAPDQAISEFIAESEEIIGRLNSNLSQLESGPFTQEKIDSIYRDIHTLKGTSQLFGFINIGLIGHALEACLEPVRSKRIGLIPKLINVIFACLDHVDRILKAPEKELTKDGATKKETECIIAQLIEVAVDSQHGNFKLTRENYFPPDDTEVTKQTLLALLPKKDDSNPISSPTQKTTKSQDNQKSSSDLSKRDDLEATLLRVKSELEVQESPASEASTIRVQISVLDRLMNLAGEMVLLRNQVLQYSQKNDNFEFLNIRQRLDLVTSELQEDVMKTRMQPIGNVLSKFTRVVREISRDLNKKIEFTVKGAETELDKSLLEAIKDPLTHIIRNSCDHGIETPEERRRNSKSESGHVEVLAFQEGGQVIIEISDDGRGLNLPKILAKAIEMGVVSPEKAATLLERDIAQLIFAPGFSTAEHISTLSGRGVGMDVVKTNIDKVGGTVDITTKPGRGTKIRLRIPLTLAIVPAMIVRSESEVFAIPQIKVQELLRIDLDSENHKIENLQGQSIFRLRGHLLPLVFLNDLLDLPNQSGRTKSNNDIYNIVVLTTDGEPFGLVVDEILDTADIVVKPLPQFLKRLSTFSGSTIMGDGSVALIVDVGGIAQKANLKTATQMSKNDKSRRGIDDVKSHFIENQELLFFSLNGQGKYCLPLILVHRLEEIPVQYIEDVGRERIARYRDSILPIINLNQYFKLPHSSQETQRDKSSVIVVSKKRRLFGIEVNEIYDVINIKSDIESPLQERKGVLGNVINEKQIATVIDALGIIEDITEPNKTTASKSQKALKKRARVLFAEDTRFFVQHVQKILAEANIELVHAPDGDAAFKVLKNASAGEFDLVLSDIEMPIMNGFELAEKIRMEPKWKSIPMIALSTRFREADVKKGIEVGFNQYLEKLKADQLLEAIKNQLEGVVA